MDLLNKDFLYSQLKQLIKTNFVCVANLNENTIKQYYIKQDDAASIHFFRMRFPVDGIMMYRYIISAEEDILEEILVSAKSKHLTADEARIIDLFDLCSARVIYQETQDVMQKSIDTIGIKMRFN